MNLNIKELDNTIILEFFGESDPSFIKKFSEVAEDVNKKNKDVEIDLSNATYLDSSTIGILIKIHKNQKQKNLKFAITSASDRVMSLLKLCSLSEALQ